MTEKRYTLAALAEHLQVEYRGDADCQVTGIAPLDKATADQISFLDNPRYRPFLKETKAAIVILAPSNVKDYEGNALLMENPYLGFAKVASLFASQLEMTAGTHATAVVDPSCELHPSASISANCVLGKRVRCDENVYIGPGCVIGDDTHIGAGSRLYANVTLYHKVTLGERVILHSGVVVGSDGFGLANDKGRWMKVPQLGGVRIANDVEIGANTTIDRGALDDTVIHEGVKLDNQIQVGHNVSIGAHTAIAGQTGIAGSAKIGQHCLIAGDCAINGHISITDRVTITATSAVSNSIDEPGVYSSGSSVQPYAVWRKNTARLRNLDQIAKRLQTLEKKVNDVFKELG